MHFDGVKDKCDTISPIFLDLPTDKQQEALALILKVNERHLHCDDKEVWPRVHYLITEKFALYHKNKQQKRLNAAVHPVGGPGNLALPPASLFGARQASSMIPLSQAAYDSILKDLKGGLETTFHDPMFTNPIVEALQQHIMAPLSNNAELVHLVCQWIQLNVMYLPLGTHLLPAYKEDMAGTSSFAKHVMLHNKLLIIPEALSQKTVLQMSAFLSEAAQAHARSYGPTQPRTEQPTAVMLSCKNGAGGHTAPAQAMAARLKERGWRVETINYDTDLSAECDPFQLLGVTFEDGTPMTHTLYITRWQMQKHNSEVARIVNYYIHARQWLAPDLFVDDSGGDLLRNKILPLNPQVLITTLAYHWTWKTLAYRVTSAKTILAASDVFFHREAYMPWYRQQSIDPRLRQMHFTTMTDDLELLKSMGTSHDRYYTTKYPGHPLHSMLPLCNGMQLDSQISVIGAPIHPAFDAITDAREIARLRQKWGIPEDTMSICISRGKLGYDTDLIPALESYRTTERLPKPVILQVVCGENTPMYERLGAGAYKDLGPNITVKPHPLLDPKDFAELRAISTLDDIKAGGGSTFEGWYLISKGTPSMLLLTPGPKLWWELSNCDAMEKWGVGRTVSEDTNKIAIIKQIMLNGLPSITHRFPDWKPHFDKAVDALLPAKETQ